MTVKYHIITIDGCETLTLGGTLVDAGDDHVWLTSVQGEQFLYLPKDLVREITKEEAEFRLANLHEQGKTIEAMLLKTGQQATFVPEQKPTALIKKPLPPWPQCDHPILN